MALSTQMVGGQMEVTEIDGTVKEVLAAIAEELELTDTAVGDYLDEEGISIVDKSDFCQSSINMFIESLPF